MDTPLRQTTGIFETVNGQMSGGGGGECFMQPRKIPPKRNVVVLLDIKLLLQFAECILLCF